MADSFIDALNAMKTLLEGDASLGAFCQTKWAKDLAVKISFKRRPEIHARDLPLVLITRPGVSDRSMAGTRRQGKHRVRLYAGFYQPDTDRVVAEQIGFEEVIDDVFIRNYNLSGQAINTTVVDSANDEGSHHPLCFTVMDLEVLYRRAVGPVA